MSAPAAQPLSGSQKRQIRFILAGAAAAAAILWFAQPKITDLGPLDFTLSGPRTLEFCDPRNPRFLPVANRPSPVQLQQVRPGVFTLRTLRGKPIGDMNLVERRLRFYAVDAQARRFAAVDAKPGKEEGQWLAAIPWGMTRIFADFTPVATTREMYATCTLPFGGQSAATAGPDSGVKGSGAGGGGAAALKLTSEPVIFARHPTDFSLVSPGQIVRAELAAFDVNDAGPNGFLVHPSDQSVTLPVASESHFQVTFTDPGSYVVWADCQLDGRPAQTRLAFRVVP